MLPDDSLRYRATTIRTRHGSLALNTLRIDLSDDNRPLVVKAVAAWRAARGSDPVPLVDALLHAFPAGGGDPAKVFSDTLLDPPEAGAPVAVILAALLLSQTEAGADVNLDEVAQLSAWSDIAVLEFARQLSDPERDAQRAAETAKRIAELGVPMLSPVVDVLRAQMERLDQTELPPEWGAVRDRLRERFAETLVFHRSGAMFPLFAATTPELFPAWERARSLLCRPVYARTLTTG